MSATQQPIISSPREYSRGQKQDTEAVEAGSLTNLEGSELRGIGRSFDLSVLGGESSSAPSDLCYPGFPSLGLACIQSSFPRGAEDLECVVHIKLLPPELVRKGSDPLVPGWLRILTQGGQVKSPDRSGAEVKIQSPCVASPSDLAVFFGDPQGSPGAEAGAAYLEACILRYVPYCTCKSEATSLDVQSSGNLS